jgi:uncharacterized protein (DUF2164 family)
MKRTWERLTTEEKAIAKEELISFFEHERGEKIGVIAAEELLNFFLQNVGPKIYNKGLSDAKAVLDSRMEDLKFDLDDLLEI